jgi:hypothetical protein
LDDETGNSQAPLAEEEGRRNRAESSIAKRLRQTPVHGAAVKKCLIPNRRFLFLKMASKIGSRCQCGKTYEVILQEKNCDDNFCCTAEWEENNSGKICGESLDDHPSSAGNISFLLSL